MVELWTGRTGSAGPSWRTPSPTRSSMDRSRSAQPPRTGRPLSTGWPRPGVRPVSRAWCEGQRVEVRARQEPLGQRDTAILIASLGQPAPESEFPEQPWLLWKLCVVRAV